MPLTAKVPILVASLVIVLAAIMSTALLIGISEEQQNQNAALGNAYLEGVAASLAPALAHRDVWDAYDTLDRSRQAFGLDRLVLAAALLPDGHVLASTDPRRLPVGVMASPVMARPRSSPDQQVDSDLLQMAKDIDDSGVTLGRVVVELSTGPEHQARRRVATLLLAANVAVAAVCAVIGWWLTGRLLRPVFLLSRQFSQGTESSPRTVDLAQVQRFGSEFQSLFHTYNRMVQAATDRETLAARCAEEERLATLGALAGSMAHEVNNPLGGMLMTIDTLSVHGSDENVRMHSLGLLRRGLESIRTIVQATLVVYKSGSGVGPLTPEALDDLRYLVRPEAVRREVSLAWDNRLRDVAQVDVTAVRQAVLTVILNAVVASPSMGVVCFSADCSEGVLRVEVRDEGLGLPASAESVLLSPGMRPPAEAMGLGLWSAARSVAAAGGTIKRASSAAGTIVVMLFPTQVPHATNSA